MVPKLKSQRSAQATRKQSRQSRSASCHATSRTAPNRQPNKQNVICRDRNLNKSIFEEGGLLDGTEVAYFDNGKQLLKGYKAGSQIFCYCCFGKISPSEFEKHAFRGSVNEPHKKPYSYIQLENGNSLHKAAQYLREVRSLTERNSSADGDKGLLCDDCHSFFHKDSASLQMNTPAKWKCGFCGKEYIEQKFYASEHPIIKTDECATCAVGKKEVEKPDMCALTMCSGYKKCDCEFGPLAFITCGQCEKQFHVCCLKEYGNYNLKEKPKGK